MRILAILAACLALVAAAGSAEVLPQPGGSNPRMQTVRWQAGETVLLTMLPGSALTVILDPGEQINQTAVSDASAWHVTVSSEQNSFQIEPRSVSREGSLQVTTDRRAYRFALRVDSGLTAAYFVQFQYGELSPSSASALTPQASAVSRPSSVSWKLTGDHEVRPASVSDDGSKTTIAFRPDQALPAVLAIGPTGDEEVVNGHMRSDVYVIDRVHPELVFRIDRKRAIARRTSPK